MTTSKTLAGEVDLFLPADLFDLMAPEDPDEARTAFHELFGKMFPRMNATDRGVMADGLLTWRSHLLADGVLLHGLVAVPASDDVETPAHWHIMAGVIDVPSFAELDTGALAAQYFGQELTSDRAYTESYDTEMGWGVGLITQVPMTPPTSQPGRPPVDPASATMLPPLLGMSAAVSAPRGGNRGLLVVGICLDVERTLDMAAIVAVIAGHSTMRLDTTPDEESHVEPTA